MTLQDLMRITRGFERISFDYFAPVLKSGGYTDAKGAGGMYKQFRQNPGKFLQNHMEAPYVKKLFMIAWTLGEEP